MALAVPMIVFVLFSSMFPIVFFTVPLPVTRLILGHVHVIVPFVLDEIDGAATGIILGAVLAPVFLMTGRYVHVDGLIDNTGGNRMNHDGLRVDDLRLRIIVDVNAAIESGLADTDRNPDIGGIS
jgi:hypothetical protein